MESNASPWPCPGDTFFAPDGDWWQNACLGWSRDQWFAYTEGYRVAAEVLLDHVLTSSRDLDTLVYPIVFNFRHYCELKLKFIIVSVSDLLDRPRTFPQTHRLSLLWATAHPLLAEVFGGQERGELSTVGSLITELDANDSSSMVFRYPQDLKGARYHVEDRRIGFGRFATTAQNLSAFFDGCTCAIQRHREEKAELQSHFLPDGVSDRNAADSAGPGLLMPGPSPRLRIRS